MNQRGFTPIIALIVILVLLVSGGGVLYLNQKSNAVSIAVPSPPPFVGSSPTSRKLCTSDKDCGLNQQCVSPGPVAVDPSKNKSYCWDRGEAVPL